MKLNTTIVLFLLSAVLLMLVAGCSTTPGPTTQTPTPTMTMTPTPTPTMTMTPTPTPTMTMTPTPTPTMTATTAPPTQTTAPPPTTVDTTPTQTSAGAVTVDLVAQNIAFDKKEISVPACSAVTINFDNKDSGIPHNFALYTNSQATTNLFKGQIITGVKTIQYTFTAPCTPGDYYFRCDVHPTIMYGTFTVT